MRLSERERSAHIGPGGILHSKTCEKEEEMIRLVGKELDLDASRVLYGRELTSQCMQEDFEAANGEWFVQEGWLTGISRKNEGGMIYTLESYPGDTIMEFEGRTVPPCANDLNFTWNAEGWDAEKNDAGASYIGSLNGWWQSKLGLEKYPLCLVRSTTALFGFESGRVYHVVAGTIQGHCFIVVNGIAAIEVFDPEPLDTARYGRIGFGTYFSHVQVRNLKIRTPRWKPLVQEYAANF
jgi:hypothetical protein